MRLYHIRDLMTHINNEGLALCINLKLKDKMKNELYGSKNKSRIILFPIKI